MELTGNSHTEIINYLIKKFNFKTYLEIGVYNGANFIQIDAPYKECCDITDENLNYFVDTPLMQSKDISYIMTSDEMFELMQPSKKFDLIFIDGYHSEDQLDRDIKNSLKHLNKNGLVLCHDILPINKKGSINYFDMHYNGLWCGDCFNSIVKLNSENLEFYTIDNGDFGLTIIKACENPYMLKFDKIRSNNTYENLFMNQDDTENKFTNNYTYQGKCALHIISLDEFKNIF